MSGAKTDIAGLIDRLGAAALEAKQLLRDLHGAVKDARGARDEAKKVTQEWVQSLIESEVRSGLDKFNETNKNARDQAVERIFRSFDDIKDTLLGISHARKHGEDSIPEMVDRMVKNLVNPHCPHCGEPTPEFTSVDLDEDKRPTKGSIGICWNCSGFNTYESPYRLRAATAAEIEDAMASPMVVRFLQDRTKVGEVLPGVTKLRDIPGLGGFVLYPEDR